MLRNAVHLALWCSTSMTRKVKRTQEVSISYLYIHNRSIATCSYYSNSTSWTCDTDDDTNHKDTAVSKSPRTVDIQEFYSPDEYTERYHSSELLSILCVPQAVLTASGNPPPPPKPLQGARITSPVPEPAGILGVPPPCGQAVPHDHGGDGGSAGHC